MDHIDIAYDNCLLSTQAKFDIIMQNNAIKSVAALF